MPLRPMPPCRYPGCPELQHPQGRGYCQAHMRERYRRDAERRGNSRQRGYTRHYEKVRAWVLAHNPLCVLCRAEGRLVVADVTHHVVPLSEGGSNTARNLVPLCRDHHVYVHTKAGAARLREMGYTGERAARPRHGP